MIAANVFTDALKKIGIQTYTGTPCSYLRPFINAVIEDPTLHYIPAPNEGDAVALACGARVAGSQVAVMFQNSGLGNAVNPLTSLAQILEIPFLGITTWRANPKSAKADEPQHQLMGPITPHLLDVMQIPYSFFPKEISEVAPAIESIQYYLNERARPYFLIMEENSTLPYELQKKYFEYDSSLTRFEAISIIKKFVNANNSKSVIVASTGYVGRELFATGDADNQWYMVGSMGCAIPLSIGIALAPGVKEQNIPVYTLDGDGALLMRLQNFAFLGQFLSQNPQIPFTHILIDNAVHDSTGGQESLSQLLNWEMMSQACGIPSAAVVCDEQQLQRALKDKKTFIHVKVNQEKIQNPPRPKEHPRENTRRLMNYLNTPPLPRALELKITPQSSLFNVERELLFNPGPATTTQSVKWAQVMPDLCPRERELNDAVVDIQQGILSALALDPKRFEVIPLGGPGTAGVEAVIGSAFAKTRDHLLIVSNGAYGERMGQICKHLSISHHTLALPWDRPVLKTDYPQIIDLIEKAQSSRPFTGVSIVHHETTSGVLNDISPLCEICERFKLISVVDAMSAMFGINFDYSPFDFSVASSNKCIHGMPGVALVIANKAALQKIEEEQPKSLSLNIKLQSNYLQKQQQFAFTAPVQTLFTLRQAVKELNLLGTNGAGVAIRSKHYHQLSELMRQEFINLGFSPYLKPEYQGPILTTFSDHPHPRFDFNHYHDYLRTVGITVYPGKGLAPKTFRLSVIGDLKVLDVHQLVNKTNYYLQCLDS